MPVRGKHEPYRKLEGYELGAFVFKSLYEVKEISNVL